MSPTELSRRAILTGAASVPALASVPPPQPAICYFHIGLHATARSYRAICAPARVALRLRQAGKGMGRRNRQAFFAATGVTNEQRRDIDRDDPRWSELDAADEKS